MTKNTFFAAAALVIGAAVYFVAVGAPINAGPPNVTQPEPARWQIHRAELIYSNGEEEKNFVNSLLLDANTGQTWVFTTDDEGEFVWSELPKR